MSQKYIIITLLAILFTACQKEEPKEVSETPKIFYTSLEPNKVHLLDSTALVVLTFAFTDGDGDLGWDPAEETINIYVKDSRDTSSLDYTYEYPFPYIPESLRPKNGVLFGETSLNFGREFFFPQDSLHAAIGKDTMHFQVYIKDTTGNKSNVIETENIYISMD